MMVQSYLPRKTLAKPTKADFQAYEDEPQFNTLDRDHSQLLLQDMQMVHAACPALVITNKPIFPRYCTSVHVTNGRSVRLWLRQGLLLRLHLSVPIGVDRWWLVGHWQ